MGTVYEKTLMDIVGNRIDMPLTAITKEVNERRLTRSKHNNKLTADKVKERLIIYHISFVDDTNTNSNNKNVYNSYKSMFFWNMDNNIGDLLQVGEFKIPVDITDYTNELHNYMIFGLPYEYFKVNPKYIPTSPTIKITKYPGGILFTYKFYLKYANDGLF